MHGHSFAGVGLGDDTAEALLRRVKAKPAACAIWRAASVLIIDEISMIDGILFDKIEYIARAIRNDLRPFGGIQVILCGEYPKTQYCAVIVSHPYRQECKACSPCVLAVRGIFSYIFIS